MELTAVARWLNTAFSGFDRSILSFFYTLSQHASPLLTPIAELLAFVGDGGLLCFCLSAVLLCFRKTRKAGIAILFSIAVGAILTNLTLKPLIARPRPFQADPVFAQWWQEIGAHTQSEYSFPSGHVTAAMASMTGLCLTLAKKWYIISPAAAYVLVMGASRNYLMVHYPSDVLGGILIGGIAGILGFLLIRSLWHAVETHPEQKFCRFLLSANLTFGKKKG